jgi:hypothetical protein
MIVKPTSKENRELNLNPKIKLPRDRYSLRIKDEEVSVSKKGNSMQVLTFEFVSPDTFINPVDGSTVNIGGVEINKKYYVPLQSKNDDGTVDEKKSQEAFDRYSDLRTKLGVPVDPDAGVDVENPPSVFKGLVIDAICDAEEVARRKDATPEQRAKKQLGEIIKDASGQPVRAYFTNVVEILGLADSSATAAASSRPY